VDHALLREGVCRTCAEFALTVENLSQILFSDESRIVHVKMMEGKLKVLHG
jgi:hypothetical protein